MFALFVYVFFSVTYVLAAFPDPKTLWRFGELNASDTLYAGIPVLEDVTHVLIHNASLTGRTYSHHAAIEYFDGDIWVAWSSGLIDEDQNGQQSWVVKGSKHRGTADWSFDRPRVVVGSALLPNQTSEANYTYWCNNMIVQRASQPNGFVKFQSVIYSIVEFADIVCYGSGKYTTGSGRMVIPLSGPKSTGCWLTQNKFTVEHLYSETHLPMRLCQPHLRDGLNKLLTRPDILPFSNDKLINAQNFYASDGVTTLQEVTHAVWHGHPTSGYWQRFWRDVRGSNNSLVNWVEFSATGEDWFPLVVTPERNSIYSTNIPDSNTKSFYGALPNGKGTYLIHNPQYYPDTRFRQPLVVSVARDGVHFDWSRVIRTNGSSNIIPDTRGIKRVGFSYPHATVTDKELLVVYSEAKENIWMTRIPLDVLDV
ncbi:hypothetical protein BDZ89DRAFT_1127202 [Hymenopellis radicata]|nr:hypothetical protein BDZ89DRAFT_1127202 [Hymenopellis radicata]